MEPPLATAWEVVITPARYPLCRLARACCRRPQMAIWVTAAPITTNRMVVSMSSRFAIVSRLYGTVRKKSNHTALDTAAITPAGRIPKEATATMTSTSSKAAFALSKLCRNGTNTAETINGTNTAAASTGLR
jgi:hypothetical protein